jgi:LPS sulfotransferase NodH
MIVLSVGMPRAGSGWHYNLVHDLLQTTGCAGTADIRRRFHLGRVLTEVNFNIGVLSARRLALVALPALVGNTFVIKAHSRPTSFFRLLRTASLIRATYIYRDPRDAMLSAMDYGSRALRRGRPNAFSHLTQFQPALDFMMTYVGIWSEWMREPGVLISRYEDLLADYAGQSRRLAEFLGLEATARPVQDVIDRYRPDRAERRQGTHFFKGRVGRFRDAFSSDQQRMLAEQFAPYLRQMGYSV